MFLWWLVSFFVSDVCSFPWRRQRALATSHATPPPRIHSRLVFIVAFFILILFLQTAIEKFPASQSVFFVAKDRLFARCDSRGLGLQRYTHSARLLARGERDLQPLVGRQSDLVRRLRTARNGKGKQKEKRKIDPLVSRQSKVWNPPPHARVLLRVPNRVPCRCARAGPPRSRPASASTPWPCRRGLRSCT